MFNFEDLKYLFKNGVVESKDTYKQDLIRNKKIIDEIDNYNKDFSQSLFLSWISNIFLRYIMLCSNEGEKYMIASFEKIHLLEKTKANWHPDLNIYNNYKDIDVDFIDYIDFTHTEDEDFILLKLCLLCTMNGESEINDKESLYYDIKLRKDNKDVLVANGTSYTSNCPNCGAPTKINTFGVCDHCQELISIYDSVWKIVNIKNV